LTQSIWPVYVIKGWLGLKLSRVEQLRLTLIHQLHEILFEVIQLALMFQDLNYVILFLLGTFAMSWNRFFKNLFILLRLNSRRNQTRTLSCKFFHLSFLFFSLLILSRKLAFGWCNLGFKMSDISVDIFYFFLQWTYLFRIVVNVDCGIMNMIDVIS